MTDMNFMTSMFVVIVLLYFAALAFGIVSYVFSGLGMYTLAKRRGIHRPWLAWLPVGESWILGCISDQYQYVVLERTKQRRILLTVLSAIALGAGIGNYTQVLHRFAGIIVAGGSMDYEQIAAMLGKLYSAVGISGLLGLAHRVISWLSLYDLYRSSKPWNATVFLVLSILIEPTRPFFLFACRNYDEGMLPEKRRTDYVPPVHDSHEPW